MSKFQRCLAIIVFILFEVYAGSRLLTAPADFSKSAVTVFGVILLIIGAISLYWALTMKGLMLPYRLALICAVLNLILGVIFVGWAGNVVNAFPTFAKIYGVIMVLMGINKLADYFMLMATGLPRRFLWLIGAILTIALGVIIFMNPFSAVEAAWAASGYMLIFSAAFDLVIFIFSLFI